MKRPRKRETAMLTLGSLNLASPLVLAPLAGITDLPFRTINRAMGCCLAFTAMISANSLAWKNPKTEKMLQTAPDDRPLGVQLLGADPETLARAADRLAEYPYDVLDLNAACPVPKVIRKGEGASLMKDPRKLYDLVRTLADRASVPITVKLRAGWDNNSRNARDVALAAQDAGASAVFIHGRTRAQEYRGRVSYVAIGEVKQALSIPVIGSGDAFSPLLIRKMLLETGCDGVAVARGALGNPWLFQEARALMSGAPLPRRPDPADIISLMSEHLRLCCAFYGDALGTKLFRKLFSWYSKGFLNIKALRIRAFAAATAAEMLQVISDMERLGMEPGTPKYASHEAGAVDP